MVLFGNETQHLNVSDPPYPCPVHPFAAAYGAIVRKGLVAGRDFYALGYIEDAEVSALVAGASALIMPSLAEGGGSYPVEEALASGVPVLCSDIPVMRESLQNGQCGRQNKGALLDRNRRHLRQLRGALLQGARPFPGLAVPYSKTRGEASGLPGQMIWEKKPASQ